MDEIIAALKKFFRIYTNPQTYLNFLYLLFAFPLGLFYFVFLVVGFSLGLGLAILWIGLFILAGTMAASWGFCALERGMAISLLKIQIAPMETQAVGPLTFWQRVKSFLTNPVTWKGLLFLLLKFPVGLAVFIFLVTGITIPAVFLASPALYRIIDIQILGPVWQVNSLPEALVLFFIGIPLLTLVLYASNWIASWLGKLAQALLGAYTIPSAAKTQSEVKAPPTTSEM